MYSATEAVHKEPVFVDEHPGGGALPYKPIRDVSFFSINS